MAGVERITANLSFTFLARASEILAGLLVVGILSRYLGLEDFGRYSVLMAMGWVALPIISMGFPKVLVREISRQRERAAEFLLIGWTWNLTMILAVTLLLALFWPGEGSRTGLLLICLATGLIGLTQTIGSLYIAFQRMEFEAVPTVLGMAALVVLIGLVVWSDRGLNWVFASYGGAQLLVLALTLVLTARLSPWLHQLGRRLPDRATVTQVAGEALNLGVFQILVQVYLYTGVFLLKGLAGNADVAIFQAPFRIFTRLQIIPMTFMPVLLPIFSRLWFDQDREEMQRTCRAVFRCMALISLALAFTCCGLAHVLIPLILGPDFNGSIPVFQVLSLATGFFFFNTLFDALFVASQKIKLLTGFQSMGVLACALCNLALIPGSAAMGTAWAIVLSSGLVFFACFFVFRDLLAGLLVKSAAAPLIGAGIGMAVPLLSERLFLVPALLIGVLACTLTALVLGLVVRTDLDLALRLVRRKRTPIEQPTR